MIASVAVGIGFGDVFTDYEVLLRLLLSGASLFLVFGVSLLVDEWHRWVLGGLAILHNPVLPIRLVDPDLWQLLNIATVIFFWVVSTRRLFGVRWEEGGLD